MRPPSTYAHQRARCVGFGHIVAAIAALSAASGCLLPGEPSYARRDSTPPRVREVQPNVLAPDGGTPSVAANQVFAVIFTEQMDINSLRPGIAVLSAGTHEEQPLSLTTPEPVVDEVDTDVPQTVQVAAASGAFLRGGYTLVLRTLLLDAQGNALESEHTGAFTVP